MFSLQSIITCYELQPNFKKFLPLNFTFDFQEEEKKNLEENNDINQFLNTYFLL